MSDLRSRLERAPFARSVKVEVDAVLASARLCPAELEAAEARGSLEVEALPRILLEVGGTVVAEGRILRRRGAAYFKVERMAALGEGGGE